MTVDKVKPFTIALARGCHQEATEPPYSQDRFTISTLSPFANGSRPTIVVTVVSKTGRKRDLAALKTASWALTSVSLSRIKLKVSISTILLFTTIPAKATIPTPVRTVLKTA